MKLLKIIIISCFIIALNCTNTSHSIIVDNVNKGEIFINNQPFHSYILSKHGFTQNDTLYFLKFSKEKNTFRFIFADSSVIDTTIVTKGENYYYVDLKTGELSLN